jgi:uncharacterized membrane protein
MFGSGRGDSFRIVPVWFAFGFPAFFAVPTIFWLMAVRPSFRVF